MTKQEFWEKLGYILEYYEIPCERCPAIYTVECCKSCEYALKAMYERLEREGNDD
jgi:phage gp36-like protein